MMKLPFVTLVLAACAGCAPSTPRAATTVRFANAPAVTVVDDRRDVPRSPTIRKFMQILYQFEGSFYSRVLRSFEVRKPERALGVNALDEVPDSTWFTNRINRVRLTPEQVRIGPATGGNPEDFRPWTILSTKAGGVSQGFIVEDTRGARFLLKFDLAGAPESETATAVIVNRLLWAAGLNVPEDYIVDINRRDLVIGAQARVKDVIEDRRLTPEDLDAILATMETAQDGRLRGLASRLIDGQVIGGHPGTGVRRDDPNDVIPHERRRDLRGFFAVYAWLDHTDLKESNTVDVWRPDPADPRRHYVVHYHVDFGRALGTMAVANGDPRRGYAYSFDPEAALATLASLGLRERDWEDRAPPMLRGLGMYEAHDFDPGTWHPYTPSYEPILNADRFDNYWGAKLVMSFTPAQIRAAVAAGELSDPIAAEYLALQILARQRLTGAYWFARVNPLDRFVVSGEGARTGLCFDDLALTYRLLGSAATTRYTMITTDRRDRPLGRPFSMGARDGGHSCTGPLPTAGDGDGYTIVKLTTHGRGTPLSTHVHLARDPSSGAYRVIGIERR